jgi:hypothetical protein
MTRHSFFRDHIVNRSGAENTIFDICWASNVV